MADNSEVQLLVDRHAKFFLRTLQVLPGSFESYDTQRGTFAFFAVSGLDLLDRLDLIQDMKPKIIDWIYRNLINSTSYPGDAPHVGRGGFRGSTTFRLGKTEDPSHRHDYSHIAMTYTSLAILLILGDDLSRVDREAIATGLRALQLEDGSFKAAVEGGENDMRFLYCATAISFMIDNWRGVDKDRASQYVINSLSYEGGFGQGPSLESHGGSTYCAVAALSLMGNLSMLDTNSRLDKLKRWCINRQITGFQGRPNKPEDTCYTFWLGATLSLVGMDDCIDWNTAEQFVISTQDPITGGLAKWTDSQPDPLHAYLGLSGLSIRRDQTELCPVDPALNISRRARDYLTGVVHASWRQGSGQTT